MVQEQRAKQKSRAEGAQEHAPAEDVRNEELAEATDKVVADIDEVLEDQLDEEILAELDDVLERNAEEFVAAYVQQGGE